MEFLQWTCRGFWLWLRLRLIGVIVNGVVDGIVTVGLGGEVVFAGAGCCLLVSNLVAGLLVVGHLYLVYECSR